MKKIALALIATGLAVTAACGGSTAKPIPQSGTVDQTTATTSPKTSAARAAYDAYMKKYAAEMADLKAAFPNDASADPWAKTIAGACGPKEDGSEGMLMMIMTPVLVKHGHGFVEFMGDVNKLNAQIRDEGLCADKEAK